MTQEQVKEKIKKKFGTVTNFAKVSGFDRYELQKMFMPFYAKTQRYKDLLVKVNEKIKALEANPEASEISAEKLDLLKMYVEESGGVGKFCAENPDFSKDSVFQILSGKRKRMSAGVKKLFDHFQIE